MLSIFITSDHCTNKTILTLDSIHDERVSSDRIKCIAVDDWDLKKKHWIFVENRIQWKNAQNSMIDFRNTQSDLKKKLKQMKLKSEFNQTNFVHFEKKTHTQNACLLVRTVENSA